MQSTGLGSAYLLTRTTAESDNGPDAGIHLCVKLPKAKVNTSPVLKRLSSEDGMARIADTVTPEGFLSWLVSEPTRAPLSSDALIDLVKVCPPRSMFCQT